MSSLDTRLKSYWTHVKAFHLTGRDTFLVFLDNIQTQGSGPGQAAATRFLLRHRQKVNNVSDTC